MTFLKSNQEDFDVTAWDANSNYEGGFVTIAQAGVDNGQLQNSRVSFADGNTKEDFDQLNESINKCKKIFEIK